jgi:hypothetical protein
MINILAKMATEVLQSNFDKTYPLFFFSHLATILPNALTQIIQPLLL